MFHQAEKYESDFTDTLSGFNAGMCFCGVCVCVCMNARKLAYMYIYIKKRETELREKRKRCDEMLYLQSGCYIFAQD